MKRLERRLVTARYCDNCFADITNVNGTLGVRFKDGRNFDFCDEKCREPFINDQQGQKRSNES